MMVRVCSLDHTTALSLIWDFETGKTLHVLEGHTDLVSRLALSNDGTPLITGSLDGAVCVWDVETGKILRILEGCAD